MYLWKCYVKRIYLKAPHKYLLFQKIYKVTCPIQMPVFNPDLVSVNTSYLLFPWMANVDAGLRYLSVTELAVVSTLCDDNQMLCRSHTRKTIFQEK